MLTPVALVLHYATGAGDVVVFVVCALALVPLAWLIGESTEQLAEHTGHGIGGFLNATFGNAPELIIAIIAVQHAKFVVVLASITGSVVSNLLLVFGLTLLVSTDRERLERRSLLPQLGVIAIAVAAFVIPSAPHWDHHRLVLASIPVACVLLVLYLASTARGLSRHAARETEPSASAWRMRNAVIALALAATATAFVSEGLVGALDGFGHAVGLSEFFIAVVIVALVGNAAEHGGAIVVARRGKTRLASEIAISSSAQVALLVPAIAVLVSLFFAERLTLHFKWVELATMGIAAALVAFVVRDGRSTRREGAALATAYAGAVVAYWFS